jgi:hypothetical protein
VATTLVPAGAEEFLPWQLLACLGGVILAAAPGDPSVAFVLGLLLPYVSAEPAAFDLACGVLVALRWAPAVFRAWRASGRPFVWLVLPHLFPADRALLWFLAASVFSLLVAGGSLRYLLLTLYMAVLYLLCRGWDSRTVRSFVTGYAIAAVVELAVALGARVAGGSWASIVMYGFFRVKGTFKDPNVFGAFYVPLFVAAADRLLSRFPEACCARQARVLFLAAVAILGIVASYSRGAALGASVGVTVLWLLRGAYRRWSVTVRAVLSLALAAVLALAVHAGVILAEEMREHAAAGLALPQAVSMALTRLRVEFDDRSELKEYDSERFGAQAAGLELAWRYPFGIGPGRFADVVGIDPHSLYVRALVENGWLGLVTLVSWMGASADALWRCRPRDDWPVSRALLLSLLAGLAVHSFVISTLHWRHFWLIFGLASGSPQWEGAKPSVSHDVRV